MSTNLEYIARERQRKEKVGGGPAKLNEKKGDGDLKKFFVAALTKWEMVAATNNARWKWVAVEKSEREHVWHFLHKNNV